MEDPSPSSDLSLEQLGPGSLPLSSGVYVHYTGCAMIQPTTLPLPHREEGLGDEKRDQSLDVISSCKLLPSPGESGDLGSSGCDAPRYGFHWFWNHFHLRQRSMQASLTEKHKQLLEDFKSYCANDSIMLPLFCSQLLEQAELRPQ